MEAEIPPTITTTRPVINSASQSASIRGAFFLVMADKSPGLLGASVVNKISILN